ncbi:MAG: TonB-dependent receptor [Gemmatimonadales bacterium]|nr:TonB-dependent receptor [Gemmatimonadales bacterium]
MRLPFWLASMAALPVLASVAAAQADSARADTTKSSRLPELEVRVTRAPEDRTRLPMAVHFLDGEALRRAQLTSGLDESLSRLPGVLVLNRYNYSLDQRVSLRGAGSRANFGLRGVKVLIDGIPQTLPDGQSQLSNLDLGVVNRVEVLTGPAGALYGNASGGVLSFTTDVPWGPFYARLRVAGGSFGTTKWQGVATARRGRAEGLISYSRLDADGFRQHSAARQTQLVAKGNLTLSEFSTLSLRLALSDAPKAENPGALTAAEYAVRRDSAAGSNILRGADKAVSQQQLALSYRWIDRTGATFEASAFGILRDLANPLAAPPPAPITATSGTYNTIDRVVGGVRAAGTVPLGGLGRDIRLSAGVDLQTMRDNRTNARSNGGAPTADLLVDQRETVTEFGPFAQLHWQATPAVLFLGAVRYDRLDFRVTDRLLADGVDNGGKRVMESVSGSGGVSLALAPSTTVYANLATSFESPTTTELVNQPNGTGGFNTILGPQRTLSAEVGARSRLGENIDLSIAVFSSWIRDAIVQAREQDGRAFFQNAGRVRNQGLEAGIGAAPWPWLRLDGAYTYAKYRFTEYRIPNGAAVDTLDGKRLPGVPQHFFRMSALGSFGAFRVELEQSGAGDVFGDDRNTLRVDGWGAGTTSFRVSGTIKRGGLSFEPFAAANNLFDRRYVGSVNLNGAGGRILEPAPGRTIYVGLEVSWPGW